MDWLTQISISSIVTGAVTVLVLLVAWFDLRERRIPNLLTLPAILSGVVVQSSRGWDGFWFGMQGCGLGLALLLVPYALGGMKAGDVKFLAAIGAWVGTADIFRVFWATVLFYPFFALVLVLRERKLRLTLRRLGRLVGNFLGFFVPSFKLYAARVEAKGEADIPSVRTPFGVAIAAGTLIALHTGFLR